jgi:four helix bundle protein
MKRTEAEAKHYQTFEDLEVYQVAREFRKAVYRVAKRLPEEEKFGLASQIRRAAVSLTNNIAEGHGRFHFLEQIKFMRQARGSLEELLDDLNVCEDEAYLAAQESETLKQEGWRVHKLINGYIRFLRSVPPEILRASGKVLPITISTRTISKTCNLGRFNPSSL